MHDENANSIGGVAGHAGLFSTASDLAIFSQMMLNGGIYGWKRIFQSETIKDFTKRANLIQGSSRALGWDTPSGKATGGVYLSESSFGHTGFTGTSLWIDPNKKIIIILLTNRTYPKREKIGMQNVVKSVRVVERAMGGFNKQVLKSEIPIREKCRG